MTSYNLGGNRDLKRVAINGVQHDVLKVRLIHRDTDPWRFNPEFSGDSLTLKSSKTGSLTLSNVSSDGWMEIHPVGEVDEENCIYVAGGAIELKEVVD